MTTLLEKFNTDQEKKLPTPEGYPKSGDTIKVHQKIKEAGKERIQIFEGIVIATKHGKGISGTMTVRRIIDGVGVEKVFPIHSPSIDKIEVLSHAKVRRSKLYYLRTAKGTKSRLKRKELAAAIAPTEEPKPIESPVEETKTEEKK
jgi:large subunit ribosomal protein L19